MGSIQLPALHVNPPADPTEGISRLVALKGMMQAQQLQGVDLQQKQLALKDQQTLRDLYVKHSGDLDKVMADAPGAGVSPQTIQAMQLHVLDVKKKTADLVSQQGDLAVKQADLMQGAHDAVDQAPAEQKPTVYKNQVAGLQKAGVDTTQLPPEYPGDDQFKLIGATVRGHSKLVDDAVKASEAAKNTAEAAKNRYTVVNGTLMDVSGKQPTPAVGQNMNPQDWMNLVDNVVPPTGSQSMLNGRTKQQVNFYVKNGNLEAAQKAITEAGQQVGAVEKETNPLVQQGKVNVAAAEGAARANIEHQFAVMNNAALSTVPTHLVAPATAAAEKANKEWADAKSVSDRMAATMDAAKSGNVVSYQIIPEEGTLQITTSQGVHRINKTEIDQYAGGGSLWQRMQGHLGGALTGKSIPDSVLKDMAEIQNIQAQGAQSRYTNTLASINQTYGSKFQPVEMQGLTASKPAAATPSTHTFSLSAWRKANPKGNPDQAAAAAKAQGYTVVQ